MKISIITACLNGAKTIQGTLRSVLSQTWPDVEHIIIDGASTDDTLEIIRGCSSRVSRLISEPDKGIYDAMNKGLTVASGQVVAFLNADDRYSHSRVLARVATIMEGEQLDAVYGDAEFFHPHYPDRRVRRFSSERFRPDRIAWGWMPAHPTLFVRTAIFDQIGRFSTDYRIAGDYEFVARAFSRTKLRYRYLPEVLVKMQIGGMSTRGWRSTVLLNKEVLRACKENEIPTNIFKILSKYPVKLLEFLAR